MKIVRNKNRSNCTTTTTPIHHQAINAPSSAMNGSLDSDATTTQTSHNQDKSQQHKKHFHHKTKSLFRAIRDRESDASTINAHTPVRSQNYNPILLPSLMTLSESFPREDFRGESHTPTFIRILSMHSRCLQFPCFTVSVRSFVFLRFGFHLYVGWTHPSSVLCGLTGQ